MENNSNISVNQDSGNNQVSVSGISDTRLAIDVANNRSRYYAELAESYKNEAKTYRDSAQMYAEQNSNVTMAYLDDLETTLRGLINNKQDAGNYALSSAIPTKVSDLQNDSNFLTSVPMATVSSLGLVKPDGTTISVNNGIISTNISVRCIGEIITSTIPLTDSGLHLLDGTLISGSGSYADFVTYIAGLYADSSYSAIFDTEANWQAAVTANGVCGKFVYTAASGNNPATVRLPKYSNKIYTKSFASTVPVVGTGKALGLNAGNDANGGLCLNNYTVQLSSNNLNQSNGTIVTGGGIGSGQSNYLKAIGVCTDSANSGVIADLSNITTSLYGYYYIVVATTTKTDIQVDIDEIVTDLNGKADVDLSNTSNTSGLRRLVKANSNNGAWYKIYSEYDYSTGNMLGLWAECGNYYYQGSTVAGDINIAFPFVSAGYNFTNTNYTFIPQVMHSDANLSAYPCYEKYVNRTTSSTVLKVTGAYFGYGWYACGYVTTSS